MERTPCRRATRPRARRPARAHRSTRPATAPCRQPAAPRGRGLSPAQLPAAYEEDARTLGLMIEQIDLDHVALAAERMADLWPRYAGDLAGTWAGGGVSPGFASAQVTFANG